MFIFEFSCSEWVCECFFLFGVRIRDKSINGPNVRIVLRFAWFVRFKYVFRFTLPIRASCYGKSKNFCAYRALALPQPKSTLQLYCCCVCYWHCCWCRCHLDLWFLLALSCSLNLSSSFIHTFIMNARHICEFANFFFGVFVFFFIAFIFFRSTHSLGERCLELSVCDLAHTYVREKKRENYFCKCEKVTQTHTPI